MQIPVDVCQLTFVASETAKRVDSGEWTVQGAAAGPGFHGSVTVVFPTDPQIQTGVVVLRDVSADARRLYASGVEKQTNKHES